ncbi:MAG: HAMP domain-containing histidine kinase [Deltaproteobacteria bacterium]|nr:HAMP domain-containing histidine kinase [Deltaproteobacteria bacterium]MBF0523641.1 HAMP domain-containing histidine kinase [Deltaproteobacteria bacterium]
MAANQPQEQDLTLLTRMIIHDLDAPISVINRVLTRLLTGKLDLKKESHVNLIRTSLSALERVQLMLNDMQEVLTTRSLTPHIQLCDLGALIKNIADRFTALAEAEEKSLKWSFQGRHKVSTDPELINRIADNLLLNAMYHVHSRTPILLEAASHEKGFTLKVTNVGPLIPVEHLQSIFDAGTQLHLTTTRKWKGHGLGLTFCRLAAEALNGKITAANLPDGAGVFFSLEVGNIFKEKDSHD